MDLAGKNIVVLDCETLHLSMDCRHCGAPKDGGCLSTYDSQSMNDSHAYQPIGWQDYAALGLSIGCLFSYRDMGYHFFDQHTLAAFTCGLLKARPLIVSYNGTQFDGPLMLACDSQAHTEEDMLRWRALWDDSYDMLDALWCADPANKQTRGINGLDVVAQANGYGKKEMSGADAPRLWREGHYAEVVQYNMGDVLKMRKLFEHILCGKPVKRGDGRLMYLPLPHIGV